MSIRSYFFEIISKLIVIFFICEAAQTHTAKKSKVAVKNAI